MPKQINPPIAKKIAQQFEIHGDVRTDNYFWMRERDSEPVLDYLNQENAYREASMKHTEALQSKIYDEIVGRIAQSDQSVPYLKNGYYYYTRFEEGKEHIIYCRKKGSLEGVEEVILNINLLAEGHDFIDVKGLSISPDNKILAYGVDTVSRRIYTIYFKNLETGELLEDVLTNASPGVAWCNDNATMFYTQKDEALRPYKVFRHQLGTTASEDQEIFHEADDTFRCGAMRSKSGEYIFIGSFASVTTEYHYLKADQPGGDFQVFNPREREHEYSIDHFGEHFYVHTNWDAENFKVMKTPLSQTTKENWKVLIPHRTDCLVSDIELFQDFMVIEERVKGLSNLRVMSWNKQKAYNIEFEEEAYNAYLGTNLEFNTTKLRFGYTSMTTPNSVYEFDMKSQERSLLKRQKVISDTFKPENYVAEWRWATANDGTQIPMSIVYKKGLKKDGNAPLLLYGYGSYGICVDPYFSSVRLSLLDRGFVYVIAHIRGSEVMGRPWYKNGKLLQKKNTFTDFINVGEYLIEQNYSSAKHLYAMGGSAGGLLMGAVMNMRPDLFNGIISAVPFVDVINTMLDDTIPLTTGEYDEWGNPNEKEYYEYIKSYSPYDNVEAKAYPATLVTTGYHDSQVQYWEPAKWVAKLRELKTDNNPLYFYCNLETGHGGASGRFARHKETAMEYAFLLDLEGLD